MQVHQAMIQAESHLHLIRHNFHNKTLCHTNNLLISCTKCSTLIPIPVSRLNKLYNIHSLPKDHNPTVVIDSVFLQMNISTLFLAALFLIQHVHAFTYNVSVTHCYHSSVVKETSGPATRFASKLSILVQ